MAILINDTAPRAQYTATSGQTVFTVPFEFFVNSDLKVYRNSTLLTLTTNYTVTGAGLTGGGSVTCVTGATAGDTVTIVREVPVARTNDFPTYGQFTRTALTRDHDNSRARAEAREPCGGGRRPRHRPGRAEEVLLVAHRHIPPGQHGKQFAVAPQVLPVLAVGAAGFEDEGRESTHWACCFIGSVPAVDGPGEVAVTGQCPATLSLSIKSSRGHPISRAFNACTAALVGSPISKYRSPAL